MHIPSKERKCCSSDLSCVEVSKLANVFEALFHTLKSLVDDEPKSPLHVGEVMACWTYYTAISEAVGYEEEALNTTTDKETKEMVQDAMRMCRSQLGRLEAFMKKEGIPFPEVPARKPESDPNDIPLGVKKTDDEIANGVSAKVAMMIIKCANTQAQSIRYDVGLMFAGFQAEAVTFAATLKALMRRRGWLRIPPYYYAPGLPES